ncbi:unnamed protein product, partial [Didymodactylos carnosus]
MNIIDRHAHRTQESSDEDDTDAIKNKNHDVTSHLSEGELESSDDECDTNVPVVNQCNEQYTQSKRKNGHTETSRSWTQMLTGQDLSSIMSGALADKSEIIHIDDPIAQSKDPSSYLFPDDMNVEDFLSKKRQKQNKIKKKKKIKPTIQDFRKLKQLLDNEKNDELLHCVLDVIGCKRSFHFAHEAVRLKNNGVNTNDNSVKTINGDERHRTVGGIFFRILLDVNNKLVSDNERKQIKKENQLIQKTKKQQRRK